MRASLRGQKFRVSPGALRVSLITCSRSATEPALCEPGDAMRGMSQRLALVIVLVAGLLIALSAPANAAATNQISGTAEFGGSPECAAPPAEFNSYPPLVMDGSLVGCWYTHIDTARTTAGGVYLESGEELFVGNLNGGTAGTFTTTYKFEAKLNPAGSEIRGRCQHKIVAENGTGGFEGASGRVDFKDIIGATTITYEYRGHIRLA